MAGTTSGGQRDTRRDSQDDGARRDYRPTGANDGTSGFATLKRHATEFREDNISDWAAALTYYGLLSLFPALIALVSILGDLRGSQSARRRRSPTSSPRSARSTAARDLRGADRVDHVEPRAAGILFFVGLGTSPVVGVRLHRRVHAGIEHRLRDA